MNDLLTHTITGISIITESELFAGLSDEQRTLLTTSLIGFVVVLYLGIMAISFYKNVQKNKKKKTEPATGSQVFIFINPTINNNNYYSDQTSADEQPRPRRNLN